MTRTFALSGRSSTTTRALSASPMPIFAGAKTATGRIALQATRSSRTMDRARFAILRTIEWPAIGFVMAVNVA